MVRLLKRISARLGNLFLRLADGPPDAPPLADGVELPSSSDLLGQVLIRKPGGRIVIGEDSLVEGTLVAETATAVIAVGRNTFVGGQSLVDCVANISIGDDVLISHGCLIADSDNHNIHYRVRQKDLRDWRDNQDHDWSTTQTVPVRIENGSWIGARAIILKGVTVGEGAVVAAGSVVTRNVPPYTVVAGNPAKVVRDIEHDG